MLRFVFIGKPHPFSLVPLRALMRRHRLVGIVESAPREEMRRGHPIGRSRRARRRIAAWAWPSALVRLAKSSRVPYLYLDAAARSRLAAFVAASRADVICVASLSALLKQDVLAAARFGAINLHPSLLPAYPGPFPWFWQYHDAATRTGATVHRIDLGEDTGGILAQRETTIALGSPLAETMDRVTALGAEAMVAVVDALEREGSLRASPNPSHGFPKARAVRPDERFIDWAAWPLERTWHFLRAAPQWTDELAAIVRPAPGRVASVGGIERAPSSQAPGSLGRDERGTFIAHREGRIRIRLAYRPGLHLRQLAERAVALARRARSRPKPA